MSEANDLCNPWCKETNEGEEQCFSREIRENIVFLFIVCTCSTSAFITWARISADVIEGARFITTWFLTLKSRWVFKKSNDLTSDIGVVPGTMYYVPAISWTWTPGFRVPRQAALWSHDLKSLWSEQARFPRGLFNLIQYHGKQICLGHFVFRTWFTWRLEWLLVFMSSAKAPFWQTIWSTHGHQEKGNAFLATDLLTYWI